jgi:hypothetical protein
LLSCSSRKEHGAGEKADRLLRNGKVITTVEKLPDSGTRCGEVTGVVDAPLETVWKVVSDYNEHKHFMPNILECFAIRPEGLRLLEGIEAKELREIETQLKEYKTEDVAGDVVYLYGLGDFPWPMSDKAYILKIVRDSQRYTTHGTMVVGQMKENESFWELKPYGNGGCKTLVKYKLLLDPGVPAPGFAIEMATNSSLPKVIEAVRQKVKDKKYGGTGRRDTETS